MGKLNNMTVLLQSIDLLLINYVMLFICLKKKEKEKETKKRNKNIEIRKLNTVSANE